MTYNEALELAFFKRFNKRIKVKPCTFTGEPSPFRVDDERMTDFQVRFIAGFDAGWEARGGAEQPIA